jgi:hypothetical protein
LDFDRSTGGGIAFDDKVLREDAAVSVRTCLVRPAAKIAMWGLHLGAASAQHRAARMDQKRNERATRVAVIGEGACPLSALHIRCALTGMDRLRRYLDNGILELDTDVVEQPFPHGDRGFGGLSFQASTMAA